MLKEACVENFTSIPGAVERGAGRIELCDNLAVGGTTPSIGVVRKATQYCQSQGIPVMVLVRPRGGDFVYSPAEKEIMLMDIKAAIQAGAAGVVVGALTEEGELDKPFLEQILRLAGQANVDLTFHRAFDRIPPEKHRAVLDWLAQAGFSRVLTHGGSDDYSIIENIPYLKTLMESNPSIIIMPGGGVTKENLSVLARELPLKEAHGTKIV